MLIYTARAVQQGYPLYDTVWFGYTPGFIYLLAGAFRLAGFSLLVARYVSAALALLALVVVAALSQSLGKGWSGAAAVLLLVPVPHFVIMSSAVMIEVPAMALVTGAVLCAIAYMRSARRAWLAASGLLFSAALFLKPTIVSGAAPLAMAPLLTESTWRRRLGSLVLLGACSGAILLPGFLLSNPRGFVDHVLMTYVRGTSAVVVDHRYNVIQLADYLFRDKYGLPHIGLVGLSLYGLWTLWRRERRVAIVLATWPLGVAAVLISHAPLYRHHLVQILFPLAALAGLGLSAVLSGQATPRSSVGRAALAALVLVAFLESAAGVWIDLVRQRTSMSDHLDKALQAIEFLKENTAPGDYVITDAHILALRAERQVPPELTDTSRRRIRTGQLTSEMMIEAVERYHPAAIVFWERKLEPNEKLDAPGDPDFLDPRFAEWVAEHYTLAQSYSERHRIYLAR